MGVAPPLPLPLPLPLPPVPPPDITTGLEPRALATAPLKPGSAVRRRGFLALAEVELELVCMG
jgi:hypothetical protein